jgi:hypothetical protein
MNSERTPSAEKLRSDPGYRQLEVLPFQEMIPFVLTHIREKGLISMIYLIANLLMLGAVLAFILLGIMDHSLTWQRFVWQSVGGVLSGSILVIPLHELLHILAYRLLGAKRISFGADLKQFIFFVTADRFAANGRQIYFLAMIPFVVINVAVVCATILFSSRGALFSGFLLLSHNIMCIGDFAIANYVYRSKGNLYSFDEPENKRSYFFEKVKPE